MTRLLFGAVVLALGVAVNVLMGCRPVIRYPSCGQYVKRVEDGNWCSECKDPHGDFARCRSSEPLP